MSFFSVDIEADGPIPGDYSMISFGAVLVDEQLDQRFYGEMYPISDKWDPEALKVSGFSREQTMCFPSPQDTMAKFKEWIILCNKGQARFIADNNGFDWQFINYYFHHFLGSNPFGFSSTNLNSLYKGLTKDFWASFKHLRKTKHDHNPVNDALGNAQALLAMRDMGLKIKL